MDASLGDGFEVYTMPAPGNFTGDNIPDFYASFGKGVWPDSEFIAHIIVDGNNGEIVFSDSIGDFQYASPIVYDLTKNGIDEVILVNNNATKVTEGMNLKLYNNEVLVLDVRKRSGNFYSFKETRIERMELQVIKKDSIIWGTYMGLNYDGIYMPDWPYAFLWFEIIIFDHLNNASFQPWCHHLKPAPG